MPIAFTHDQQLSVHRVVDDSIPVDSSLSKTAQTLAAGLETPFAPRICPFCFVFFTKSIESDERIVEMLQPKGHAFWSATMAFISADWTPDQERIAEGLLLRKSRLCSHCACEEEKPGLLFRLTFQHACAAVHAALSTRANRYRGFGRKPRRWPTTADHLFPYGPEKTIRALVQRLEGHPAAQAVLLRLTQFHRPLVHPVMMEQDNRVLLLACITATLNACASAIDEGLRTLGYSIIPAVRRALIRKHFERCKVTVALLFTITSGTDSAEGDRQAFCQGHDLELFVALDSIASHVDNEKEYRLVGQMASQHWVALSAPQREELGRTDPPAYAREVTNFAAMKDPYIALRYHLSHRPKHRDCHAPECQRTVHDPGAPREFSLCSRCRAVRYCSRDCQRADWTSDPFPHKAVCDALQELCTFASLDSKGMTGDEFAAACHSHAFPLDRVDRLISWATRGRICTQYAHGAQSNHRLFLPADQVIKGAGGSTADELVYIIRHPRSKDGRKMTDRELYGGMVELKEKLEAEGYALSWRRV